ncbi:MAG: tRNA (guanine(46)-N(7))-methyltransferase TrmB, partial [Gammaproteobacteria bacterium]|nr:tRNA (guanine(46)-N(7))-methyltransferase TrmB [Gammaproteobacteria bacterium]
MSDISRTRPIRSFVRRNSRMTTGQKRALDKYWSRYGIKPDKETDLDKIFMRRAPKVLDIGSGMGDATIELASKIPQMDFVAVEVHQPGIGNLIRLANERKLSNIRIISEDIVTLLNSGIFKNCFDKVLIFFPDPWPKKRHHKR